jgi:hypothetical protein
VVGDQIEAIEQRDRALLKLGALTRACLLAATGLLAFFSVIAAVTIPGQGHPASTQSGSTDNTLTAQVPPVTQPLQGPTSRPLQGGSGRPVAVSGGSH